MTGTHCLLFLFAAIPTSTAFISVNDSFLKQQHSSPSFLPLCAKKSRGKGFGKTTNTGTPPKTSPPPTDMTSPRRPTDPTTDVMGASENKVVVSSTSSSSEAEAFVAKLDKPVDVDPNAPAEVRTEEILRQRFGMTTLAERNTDAEIARKKEEARERRQKLERVADAVDDFDVFAVLPAPVTKGIDLFLKLGLGVSVALFLAAGVGICVEAWAVATGNTLDPEVDAFIVNTVEPYFTPGLFVVLAFSISLGLFATAQLGSASSQYQERQ